MNDDLTPEQEGARLKELLGNRNKAQFAKDAKIPGGASMLSQHLSGHRPISLTAATAYALGLGVGVEEFSPRLAKAIAEANRATTANTPSETPRPGGGTTSAPYEAPSDSGKPDLVITQYEDTGGAMGHGFNLTDHPPGGFFSPAGCWRGEILAKYLALLLTALFSIAKVHPCRKQSGDGCQVIEPRTDMQTNAGAG